MNFLEFKIRVKLIPDDCYGIKGLFLDTLPENDIKILCGLDGEYNWFDEDSNSSEFGFSYSEVTMKAKYKEGKLEVTIESTKNFQEPREVSYGGSITYRMTFLDCIKDYINGCLSDGIGENRVGYCEYKDQKYELWLDEIETNEPLVESKLYFKVCKNRGRF